MPERLKRDVRPRRRQREFPVSIRPYTWRDAQGVLRKPYAYSRDGTAFLHRGHWRFEDFDGTVMTVEAKSQEISIAHARWREADFQRQVDEAWQRYFEIWGEDAPREG